MDDIRQGRAFIEKFRQYAPDADTFSRSTVDLIDLLTASRWLIATVDNNEEKRLSPDELLDILIEIETHFVEHVSYHLKSFRKNLRKMINNIPTDGR